MFYKLFCALFYILTERGRKVDDTDNTQYSILLNISKEIGELKGDIHNLENKISRTDSKIEEVFDALTKKQEYLRDSIESEIDIVRIDLKDARAEIARLKDRIALLEDSPKTKLFEIFEKFKGLLIAAILAAIVGYCMSFIKDLAFVVRKPPVSATQTEQTIQGE